MTKKFLLELILAVSIGGAAGGLVGNYLNERSNYREFEFRGGFTNSGGGYKKSISHVLVNEKNYDLEEMFSKVYDEYILMNGVPDELIINLYNTKYELEASDPVASKSYVID